MKSRYGTDECCGNCNYFCKVRKAPDYQEVLICICVLSIAENRRVYLLETKEDDMCEYWMKERFKI